MYMHSEMHLVSCRLVQQIKLA